MAQFREAFRFPAHASKSWFPGHMNKGLRDMARALKDTDCIIEVHDARIPLSGRNNQFKKQLSKQLPHILVLNKIDLVPKSQIKGIIAAVEASDPSTHVIGTNCKNQGCPGLKKVMPTVVDLISQSSRYNRSLNPASNILVAGIPNVGKSSLINSLRSLKLRVAGRATQVGNIPGITRAVLTKIRVNNDPLVYLIDTPGIMMPYIRNMEVGMKLALCGTIADHSVGESLIADYALFCLNKYKQFEYVDRYKLEEPVDDISKFCVRSARSMGWVSEKRDITTGDLRTYPATEIIFSKFLKDFRAGNLGHINLDRELCAGNKSSKRQVESIDEFL